MLNQAARDFLGGRGGMPPNKKMAYSPTRAAAVLQPETGRLKGRPPQECQHSGASSGGRGTDCLRRGVHVMLQRQGSLP
jgi:hypothetical protein